MTPEQMKRYTLTVSDVDRLLAAGSRANWDIVGRVKLSTGSAKRLLDSIETLARAQNSDATVPELAAEKMTGMAELGYLVKLHNLNLRAHASLAARVAVAQHIFTAQRQGSTFGLDDIKSYRAYTVFRFGPRQFDALFEMGDGTQVREAMQALAERDPTVGNVCREMGWSDAVTDTSDEREDRQPERMRA